MAPPSLLFDIFLLGVSRIQQYSLFFLLTIIFVFCIVWDAC